MFYLFLIINSILSMKNVTEHKKKLPHMQTFKQYQKIVIK